MSRTGVRIGATDLLEDLPRSVRIRDRPYILSRDDSDRLVVFEATCPHQGGTVDVESEDCLRCPQHGWEFDSTSGESTNVPGESLHAYPVEKRAEGLFADIPDIDPTVEFSVDDHDGGEPTVSLLSQVRRLHAGDRPVARWTGVPGWLDPVPAADPGRRVRR
ncbi:hypothetical protein BRC67_12000 [Halobacteriales archaeon QH_3_68_24]|nr:MAG: hypothetical protein BRC67_12000 [Halobacteriales archaeon QH_3_68_24]